MPNYEEQNKPLGVGKHMQIKHSHQSLPSKTQTFSLWFKREPLILWQTWCSCYLVRTWQVIFQPQHPVYGERSLWFSKQRPHHRYRTGVLAVDHWSQPAVGPSWSMFSPAAGPYCQDSQSCPGLSGVDVQRPLMWLNSAQPPGSIRKLCSPTRSPVMTQHRPQSI